MTSHPYRPAEGEGYNVSGLKNRMIKLVFTDGKSITGKFLNQKAYELYLETEKIPVVIIFKHSVKYLYEVIEQENEK